MKYYLGDKFLFIDMYQNYTHCVVEGTDRVICCQKSLAAAEEVCRSIRLERFSNIERMQKALDRGHEDGNKIIVCGIDIKKAYPTAGMLHGTIQSMKRSAHSVRVMPLRVEP